MSNELPKCDPVLIETLAGYWTGRAKVRAEEALRRTGDGSVPADDDLHQHRLAQEYETRAKELAA